MDKMLTLAGSYALAGSRAPREATIAEKLRDAGAIILGKTNFRSDPNNSNNGWSARGGQTYGVFYPGTDAEGSSRGSSVGSILGLALASISTEVSHQRITLKHSLITALIPVVDRRQYCLTGPKE